MSSPDATFVHIPIESHAPTLLAPEAAMLRRVRTDVADLLELFNQTQAVGDSIGFWLGLARHRHAWRSAKQSTWRRTVTRGAVGLLDPDITTACAVAILTRLEDPHAALFTGGMWWAATQACHWSAMLPLASADVTEAGLRSYLQRVTDRQDAIQRQLAGFTQLAVLDMTSDLHAARRSTFDSAEWVGARGEAPAFALTVRIEPPLLSSVRKHRAAHTPSSLAVPVPGDGLNLHY